MNLHPGGALSVGPKTEKKSMKKLSEGYSSYCEAIPGSDELMVKIPDEILMSEDWRSGDVLDLEAKERSIFITNTSKAAREYASKHDSGQ